VARKNCPSSELADDPEPLVLIPHQRPYWYVAIMLLPLATLIGFLIFLLAGRLLAPRWMDARGLWPSSLGDLFDRLHLPFWAVLIFGPPFWMGLNRVADFAVWKDGITLASMRIGPKGSISRRRDIGFYSWNEVSRCSWSHFHPGLLIVHLKRTFDRGQPDFLGLSWHAPVASTPPTLYFYPVPDPLCGAMENAIRMCGKWSE
jgi:hypothetical protein